MGVLVTTLCCSFFLHVCSVAEQIRRPVGLVSFHFLSKAGSVCNLAEYHAFYSQYWTSRGIKIFEIHVLVMWAKALLAEPAACWNVSLHVVTWMGWIWWEECCSISKRLRNRACVTNWFFFTLRSKIELELHQYFEVLYNLAWLDISECTCRPIDAKVVQNHYYGNFQEWVFMYYFISTQWLVH